MRFVKLEEGEFREFAEGCPWRSFYQTPEIAKLREQNGWTAYYFGVEDDGKVIAGAMVVARPAFMGKSVYYIPGGPLVDFEDTVVVECFFHGLKRYAKSHNGYVVHIEPYYELVERDRDGLEVEGGFRHDKAVRNLRQVGCVALAESDEPKYLFVMDLNGRTPEQLLADFKRNTRNHIRKAEKMGVKVRELSREELPILKKITESTSERRGFMDKPLKYYEQMYDLFHERGEVKFMVAEADGLELSAAMFMTYGDEVIYLFSGSDEKYMREYNAQYLIQWEMIKYAAENGFLRYNFYGINGLPDRESPDYGIYDFKKGFGGRVVELLGAYEMPVNATFYHTHKMLAKAKRR